MRSGLMESVGVKDNVKHICLISHAPLTRFGLFCLDKETGEQMQSHLPKIINLLYDIKGFGCLDDHNMTNSYLLRPHIIRFINVSCIKACFKLGDFDYVLNYYLF